MADDLFKTAAGNVTAGGAALLAVAVALSA